MVESRTDRRRVTAADVARAVGLSRATVGFVLNNTPGQTIPPATRERVLTEAKRLGYRPHNAARALASGQSRIVLLVLPEWPLDYSMRSHLDEASLVLDQAGYSLVTMTTHPGGQARPLWQSLAPDAVVGMAPFSEDVVADIQASGVQHVISSSVPSADPVPELGYASGPRLQVEHMLGRGAKSIAYAASSDPRVQDLVEQRRTLANATLTQMTGHGFTAVAPVDEESVDETVASWRKLGVDAVVAYNDDIAAIVAGAALRAGLQFPGDLAIIGHDDSPLAHLFVPSLSSVRIDSAGLGRYLAELALSAIAGAEPPVAGPETDARIVQRQST